jgi:hypothetical protein
MGLERLFLKWWHIKKLPFAYDISKLLNLLCSAFDGLIWVYTMNIHKYNPNKLLGNIEDVFNNDRMCKYDTEFEIKIHDLFNKFKNNKILAMHNWTCCNDCGHDNLQKLCEILLDQSVENYMELYIFYHTRDIVNFDDDYVYLSFGSINPDVDVTDKITSLVIPLINELDLKYEWNETDDERICIYM